MKKCLDAALVEAIHRAVILGKPVDAALEAVETASLPGLMEFACLKLVEKSKIPRLPLAIANSETATALSAASPLFQLGSIGGKQLRSDSIEVRRAEFISLCDAEMDAFELFAIRFNRSSVANGLSRDVSDQLQVALHEMAENALIHSESAVAPVAGYVVTEGLSQFCVADLGIGVLASLRTCPDFQGIHLHNAAIRAALRDGTSRFGTRKGGLGFRPIFKSLIASWGSLRFRSVEGCISMCGMDLACDRGLEHFPPPLPGFQLSIACQVPTLRNAEKNQNSFAF